jgi:hypothetical protein
LLPVRISVPTPALLSVPAPEMSAASVSVLVKFATIWPSLSIAGVMIAPASAPMPRLSVLPWAMPVKPDELTTPPSATVSVPIRGPPQPQLVSPTTTEESAFRAEPAPVTVSVEVPVESPTPRGPVTLTTPPLEMVSIPGPPPEPLPPTASEPAFQVEPAPVTVTVGVKRVSPGNGGAASIATQPGVLSTPPLEIVADTGPPNAKNSVSLLGLTVTVDPGPSMTRPEEKTTARLVVCSLPPLMIERVPPSTTVPPPGLGSVTVSEPPLMVRPPLVSHLQRSIPPIVLPWPVSVSTAPPSISSVPAPDSVPEKVVLLLPEIIRVVEGSEGPTTTLPPPASDAISAKAPSPSTIAAPVLTLKAGKNEELFAV